MDRPSYCIIPAKFICTHTITEQDGRLQSTLKLGSDILQILTRNLGVVLGGVVLPCDAVVFDHDTLLSCKKPCPRSVLWNSLLILPMSRLEEWDSTWVDLLHVIDVTIYQPHFWSVDFESDMIILVLRSWRVSDNMGMACTRISPRESNYSHTFGKRFLSNFSNFSYSSALLISTTLSALKLKMMTASPSWTAPTALSFSSTTTKGGKSWSETGFPPASLGSCRARTKS